MKLTTLLVATLLLASVNAGATQRSYFNQIGLANLTGSPISNLDVQFGKHELKCDNVNNNGYCHKMFGKRPFPQDEIELSWTDADGKQQKQQATPTVPSTMIDSRVLRFELELHADGSVKWDFRQDGIKN